MNKTSSLQLNIVSLESRIFSGEVSALYVRGSQGELGITPGHSQLLTDLPAGTVRVLLVDGSEQLFYVKGGFLEVQPGVVTILSDTAVRAADLDEAAVLQAKQRAEELLAGRSGEFNYAHAVADLAEAMAQLRAIQELRRKMRA